MCIASLLYVRHHLCCIVGCPMVIAYATFCPASPHQSDACCFACGVSCSPFVMVRPCHRVSACVVYVMCMLRVGIRFARASQAAMNESVVTHTLRSDPTVSCRMEVDRDWALVLNRWTRPSFLGASLVMAAILIKPVIPNPRTYHSPNKPLPSQPSRGGGVFPPT